MEGFKNAQWFSLAMLAKQGWRLSKIPNTYWQIVQTTKQFIFQSDFLDAELGEHPSFP